MKLKHDEPLSNVAFNCNLRPYSVVDAVDRRGREDGEPTRRERKYKLYTPRSEQRAAARAALSEGGEAAAASSR